MTALSEALLTAQRGALAAMGKAFVSSDAEDADAITETLDAIGCTDRVEQAQLINAWAVLRDHGAAVPNGATATKPPAEDEPASEAQLTLIARLYDERGQVFENRSLTKGEASKLISQLKAR